MKEKFWKDNLALRAVTTRQALSLWTAPEVLGYKVEPTQTALPTATRLKGVTNKRKFTN